MLTHPTLDQMQALGLGGMATAYRELSGHSSASDLSRDEWLGLILDREAAMRADKRLNNRLALGRLRFADACIEDVDFATHRGLDRRNTLSLAQGAWLKAHENLIITGQTGTGKTWLACAFGRQAARLDHSILYLRMPRLFEDLAMARLDGRFPRLVDKLAKVQLMVLDDWGTHGLNDQQRLDLLEIFEDHYRRKSTLITAQLPVALWHAMIGEPTIADAILDRIIHNAHRITLEGDSMRKPKPATLLTSERNSEINRTRLQPCKRDPPSPCCPGFCETIVRELAELLSRFCEMRTQASGSSSDVSQNHGIAHVIPSWALRANRRLLDSPYSACRLPTKCCI